MIEQGKPHRGRVRLVVIIALLVVVGGGVADAAVDVLALVMSSAKGPDQVSITYAGPVAHEQAKQDLQALATALGRKAARERITTKRIAPNAPQMTSVEAQLPEIVNRGEGTLPVKPFVETYRRFSTLRLSYFVEPPFKLVSPVKPEDTGDVRISVDNQGMVTTYDVLIRHAEGAGARPPGVGVPLWNRLLGLVLFLLALIAVVIGVVIFVLVRRSGTERASAG